jgi:hypothetical protein
MLVCENETAMSRGRIPTYIRRSLTDFVAVLLRSDFRSSRLSNMILQNCSLGSSFSVIMLLHYSPSRQRELLQQLLRAMNNHYSSYDLCFFIPLCYFLICLLIIQFRHLLVINFIIRCQQTRCRSTKSLALFLLLRRWNKVDTWEDVSRFVRRGSGRFGVLQCIALFFNYWHNITGDVCK